MKKFFTLMFALTAVLAVNAKQVVFDFTNPAALGITPNPTKSQGVDLSDSTIIVDGVSMTSVKNHKTSDTKLFTKSDGASYELRTYTANTITFSAAEKIQGVKFMGANIKFSELAENSDVWTGEADSVTFTATATCNIEKVTIFIGEAPEVEKFDTLTVAQAIEVADALGDGKTSEKKYYVEGYAVNVDPYSLSYNNQIFFLVDDVTKPDSVFEAYAATPKKDNQAYPVLAGDKVRLFGALQKYVDSKNGNKIQLEIVRPSVEFLEEVEGDRTIEEPKIDTISVARAIEIISALDEGGKTSETYVVQGFAGTAYAMENGKQTWYMADEPDVKAEFQAASCTPDKEVVKGDYMLVKGILTKYKSSKGNIIPEIYNGTAVHGVAPKIDTIQVNVAQAMEIGNALEDNATAEGIYAITGYVINAKAMEDEDENQDFYIADDKDAEKGPFRVYRARIAYPGVAKGYKVAVVGKIKKNVYQESVSIQMEYPSVQIIEGQGIENVVLTEKAEKVVVDGVLYIVRDGKMFNAQGAQVR